MDEVEAVFEEELRNFLAANRQYGGYCLRVWNTRIRVSFFLVADGKMTEETRIPERFMVDFVSGRNLEVVRIVTDSCKLVYYDLAIRNYEKFMKR